MAVVEGQHGFAVLVDVVRQLGIDYLYPRLVLVQGFEHHSQPDAAAQIVVALCHDHHHALMLGKRQVNDSPQDADGGSHHLGEPSISVKQMAMRRRHRLNGVLVQEVA